MLSRVIRPTSSRLQPPVLRANVVRRAKLLGKVDSEASGARWLSVVAPAGYGKTTLLATIGERCQKSHVCWFNVAHGDTLGDLANGIIGTLKVSFERLGEDVGPIAAHREYDEAAAFKIAVILADEIAEYVNESTLLVLDDLHRIDDPLAWKMLGELISQLPGHVQLATSSRVRVDLPYARFESRGELLSFDIRDLELSLEETALFVRESLGLAADDDQVQMIHERTGGWTAGLNLLNSATSALFQPGAPSKVPSWVEYIDSEVHQPQPPADRDLLIKTAMLEVLEAGACTQVMGRPIDSEQLRLIHQRNRFVEILDVNRGIYRVHDIYRDFLNSKLHLLSIIEIAALYGRAAEVIENPLEAAQTMTKVGLYDLALARLRRDVSRVLFEGNTAKLLGILEVIPADQVADQAILRYLFGICYAEKWQFSAARREFERAMAIMERYEDPMEGMAKAAWVIHSWTFADLDVVWNKTQEALASNVPDGARLGLLLNRAWQQMLRGDHDAALKDVDDALDVIDHASDPSVVYQLISSFVGPIPRVPGIARRADRILNMMKLVTRGRDIPFATNVHLFEGFLAVCRGDWDEAIDQFETTLRISDHFGGIESATTDVAKFLPGCYLMIGKHEEAEKCLQKVEAIILATNNSPYPRPWLDSVYLNSIRVALAKGENVKARALFEQYSERQDSRWPTNQWFKSYVKGRIELADGRLDRAKKSFLAALESQRQWSNLTTLGDAEVCLAYVCQQQGETEMARVYMESAVARAFDEDRPGFLFMSGREVVEPLLDNIGTEESRKLRAMVAALPELPKKGVAIPGTQDYLTPREVEVLKLVAAGASNSEIADRLVISPFTVKRHVTHLLSKLGVTSRSKAASVARELLSR